MNKTAKYLLYVIVLLSISLTFTSFSKNKTKTIQGYVHVYGNDPFAFIGIETADEKMFFRVVKAAFMQRRKTAANSLSAGLGMPKAEINILLEKSGIKPSARAEELTMQDFADIANLLADK